MSAPTFTKLSILMAAYNEEESLRHCIAAVLAAPLPGGLKREVVIVNDGSKDSTWEVMQALAAEHADTIRIFSQPKNMGKGAAIRRAISEMTGDLAIFQDADLEYDPRDILRVIQPIVDGKTNVVYGSRYMQGHIQDPSWMHRVGNWVLTTLSNQMTRSRLTDMETCYKAIRREILQSIRIEQQRFGFEPEITAKLAKRGISIVEVPISYQSRGWDEGKKIGVKDLFSTLWCIVRYRFGS